jgi:hypothetical protein
LHSGFGWPRLHTGISVSSKSLHGSLFRLARTHGNPRKWSVVMKTMF